MKLICAGKFANVFPRPTFNLEMRSPFSAAWRDDLVWRFQACVGAVILAILGLASTPMRMNFPILFSQTLIRICPMGRFLAPRLLVAFGLLAAMPVWVPGNSRAAERTIFSFARGFDVTQVRCTDASVTLRQSDTGFGLSIHTGHEQHWPGIVLSPPAGHWDLSNSAVLLADLKNTGTNAVKIYCRVDNPGADGTKHCVTDSLDLKPGQSGTLQVRLQREADGTLDGKLFGMRGYPKVAGDPDALNVTNITQVLLFVNYPKESHSFELSAIRAGGEPTPPTAWVTDANPFFPFIDTFGQYLHKDWPGKVHSLSDLQQRRSDEAAELAAKPGPPGWDQYGGWANGPQLEATGYFRTQKVDGKWWLVDPDGRLFWSHGVDCVGMLDATPTDERATWFDDFPGAQAAFAEFVGRGFALKGHYAGRTVNTFSFAGANLKRKYGEHWRQEYAETVHRRLRSWGLNTIANWSDSYIYLMRRTPYTDNLGSSGAKMIEGSEGYWGRFPDVFDAGFAASLHRAMAAKNNSSANDPWCIGYFSDNEMSWGDETSLALGVLRSPADQAAKGEFVKNLKAKYGDVAKLNVVWGAGYKSWDDLLACRTAPDAARARVDLTAFSTKLAETYFRTVRETIKSVAPHQLYLGCRFAWVNGDAAKAAGKYCDVVSYNLYRRSIADFKYPGGDKPLLVGEFHFGALDRGLFHTGLVPVENQAHRAEAYHDYVLGALRHPQFVGTHWFQWQDEPVTGRVYDEENYQIGMDDVADTPYRETVEASRDLGRQLYQLRLAQAGMSKPDATPASMLNVESLSPAEILRAAARQPATEVQGEGWQSLFDGSSFTGWRMTDFGGVGRVELQHGLMFFRMGGPFSGVNYTNPFPKMNYEVTLEAMRVKGDDFFCGLTFPIGNAFASLIVGGWGGSVTGISSIDGNDASQNETTQTIDFDSGRWYRIRLRVTEHRLEAWIDQKRVVNVKTDGLQFSLRPGDISLSKPFGLATWVTSAAMRDIKLRRVTEPSD